MYISNRDRLIQSYRLSSIDCLAKIFSYPRISSLACKWIDSIENLRRCRLTFLDVITPISKHSNRTSRNEILEIKIRDGSSSSVVILRLNSMPKLKEFLCHKLDVCVRNCEWILSDSFFILSEVEHVKMIYSSNYSLPSIFQCLHVNFPKLKSFELDLTFDFINENLFDHLLNFWCANRLTNLKLLFNVKIIFRYIMVKEHKRI